MTNRCTETNKHSSATHSSLAVLKQVRELIRGKDLEHVWMNYPTEPCETLGQRIDKALAAGSFTPEPHDGPFVIRNADGSIGQIVQALPSETAMWKHFDAAYQKACDSSEPRDWQHAAMLAQQVRRDTVSATRANEDFNHGFPNGDTRVDYLASKSAAPQVLESASLEAGTCSPQRSPVVAAPHDIDSSPT